MDITRAKRDYETMGNQRVRAQSVIEQIDNCKNMEMLDEIILGMLTSKTEDAKTFRLAISEMVSSFLKVYLSEVEKEFIRLKRTIENYEKQE